MAIASVDGVDYRPAAFEAVLYVRRKLTLGAGNKVIDLLSSAGASGLCVSAQRSVTTKWNTQTMEKYLRLTAGAAEGARCGNCQEQSAVAFTYLLDRGVRPIDWMALQDPGDHAFVVVGRHSRTFETDPSSWGASAVVCDPWYGSVYFAGHWKFKQKPYSIYRVDV